MDKKRKFRITVNEFRAEGGELVIGTVSVEFVKYWQERNENELIEHLESIVDGKEGDANSPPMRDGKNFPWNECDDIEHNIKPYVPYENGFKVEEITAKGAVINEKQVTINASQPNETRDAVTVYSRERYTNQINMDDENPDHDVSLLISLRGERGLDEANSWLVETDGEDFNPKKLAYGVLETDVGEFLDSVFYDKKELVIDDVGGTQGTSRRVSQVGVASSSWIEADSKTSVLKKRIDWSYYDEELKTKVILIFLQQLNKDKLWDLMV